jgi:hypothetical protein
LHKEDVGYVCDQLERFHIDQEEKKTIPVILELLLVPFSIVGFGPAKTSEDQ